MSRRRFIKNLGLAGAGLAINPLKSKPQPLNLTPPVKNNPLVISTWIHGMEANAGAWEILSNGGNALDAVQKGVAVTENDLNKPSLKRRRVDARSIVDNKQCIFSEISPMPCSATSRRLLPTLAGECAEVRRSSEGRAP